MDKLKNRRAVDRRSFLAAAGVAAGVTSLAGVAAARAQSSEDLDELARLVRVTDQASTAQLRRILRAVADEEGIQLNLDQMAVASKYNLLFVAAPALGVERIDPIELSSGITQGILYTQSSTSNLRGFYVVRAVAVQDIQLGDQPVLLQMLRGGQVLAEERGMAKIWSLTVPPTARGVQAQVGVGFETLVHGGLARSNCWVCPNGVTICADKPLRGVDGLLPREG
jgi:hypothetical protein